MRMVIYEGELMGWPTTHYNCSVMCTVQAVSFQAETLISWQVRDVALCSLCKWNHTENVIIIVYVILNSYLLWAHESKKGEWQWIEYLTFSWGLLRYVHILGERNKKNNVGLCKENMKKWVGDGTRLFISIHYAHVKRLIFFDVRLHWFFLDGQRLWRKIFQ